MAKRPARFIVVQLIIFLTAVASIVCVTAHAAEVEGTSRKLCAFRIEGAIVSGDFEKLYRTVQQNLPFDKLDERKSSVCLESMGGSYAEAIRIAELIYKQGMSTVIEYGGKCFSACAIMFMAGVLPDQERPYRRLSVGGILGFHAPYLEVPDQKYSKDELESATQSMTRAILALVRLSSRDMKLGGEFLKKSLIQRILEKGKDEVFFIKTVFDAARWDIELYDADDNYLIELAKVRGVINMCNNFHFSNLDKPISQIDLSVQVEEFSSAYHAKNFRMLVRNSRSKDVVCELYPKEDTQKRISITACSHDYWSSHSFGDCREFKTRPTILIGKHIPKFFALDPGLLLKSFSN